MGAVPKRNDLMARIERLERLVSDLTRPLTTPDPTELVDEPNAENVQNPDPEESP